MIVSKIPDTFMFRIRYSKIMTTVMPIPSGIMITPAVIATAEVALVFSRSSSSIIEERLVLCLISCNLWYVKAAAMIVPTHSVCVHRFYQVVTVEQSLYKATQTWILVSCHLLRLIQPTASAFIIALKCQPHLVLFIIWAFPGSYTVKMP